MSAACVILSTTDIEEILRPLLQGECQHRSRQDEDGVAMYSLPSYPVHVIAGAAGARMSGESVLWAGEIDQYLEDYTEKVM